MRNEDYTKELNRDLLRAHRIGLEAVALALDTAAKKLSPVDTGNLKSSITHRVDGTGAYSDANAEYAAHIEYGSYKMAAQPFMRPALYDNAKKLKALYVSQISKALL